MAKILVTPEELIMIEAFRKMREVVKSKEKKRHKEIAINSIFWKANEALDVLEGSDK